MNYMLIAEDDGGKISALVGIYPTKMGAEYIERKVSTLYRKSRFIITETDLETTVKYDSNFSEEFLKTNYNN